MGNQLRIGSMVQPTQANGGISTGCIACFPCRHGTADVVLSDISGNNNTGAPGVAFVAATAFASPQGLLTADAAATDTTMRLPAAAFTYSYNNNDSLLIATRIKLAALPGASKPVWAQGGNNTVAQGLMMKCTALGELQLQLDGPSTNYFSANTDAGGPAGDGKLTASVWHHVVAAIWNMNAAAGTGNYGIWINGARGYASSSKVISGWPPVVTPPEAFRIGQYYRSSGPVTSSIGATQSDVHLYRSPVGVLWTDTKMNALASRLYRDPSRPLSAAEWPMA